MFTFLMALIPFFLNAETAYNSKPFSVVVKGVKRDLPYIQAASELKMARSIDFCRGFYIPKPLGAWSCKKVGRTAYRCKMRFKCGLVRKDFSRKTETRRLSAYIRTLTRPSQNFQMIVSKSPFQNQNQYKFANKTKGSFASSNNTTAAEDEFDDFLGDDDFDEPKGPIKKEAIKKSADDGEDDDFSDFDEDFEDEGEEKKTQSNEEDDFSDFDENFDEDEEVNNEELEGTSEENVVTDRPATWGSKLWAFNVALISVSSEGLDSYASINLSWRPKIQWDAWFLELVLGWHKGSATVTGAEESITYNVMEYGASINWLVTNNVFVNLGMGVESWGTEPAVSESYTAFGVGYLFNKELFLGLDRLNFQYYSLGDVGGTKEIRFGAGFSF